MAELPIDPKVPVSGNFAGTLAGVVATVGVGFLTKYGLCTAAATFLGLPEATVSLLAMAVIGGAVNYAVTHFAQVKKLSELYEALPSIYPEYQKPKTDPNRQ